MTPSSPIQIHTFAPGEGQRMRKIRLAALLDTPDAFGSTHAGEVDQPDSFWEDRIAQAESLQLVATNQEGDLGIVVGAPFRGKPDTAGLFAMWVHPKGRGQGIGRQLVQTVIDWAKDQGFRRLILEVADDNIPACELYTRMGFEPTGVRGTLPPPREHITENERERLL